jgi:hypothetical protein
MDEKDLRAALSPPTPAAPDEAAQARAAELWSKIVVDLANETLHKEYLGFVLKNNLIKQASRHYAEVVDAKDRYTVEQRRVARQYQQNLLRVLFFTPTREKPSFKLSGVESLLLFVATLVMLAGFATFFADTQNISPVAAVLLKLLFPLGLASLVALLWVRVRGLKSHLNKRDG